MTDKDWLVLLEKSPKKAHYALISQYGNLVYAIVLSKLRGFATHEEIKDCVSDAFVEVFRSTDKFTGKGSLKNFISTIAKNTALNAFHRISYKRKKFVSIDNDDFELPPSIDNTEEETEKRIFNERLWDIVNSLGEPDSSIIIYQYFYEFKVREIAGKLSMTASAVQKRSIRARKRIKEIIENERSSFDEKKKR